MQKKMEIMKKDLDKASTELRTFKKKSTMGKMMMAPAHFLQNMNPGLNLPGLQALKES